MELENCENILKDVYNINKSLPLIIFKVDYQYPDLLIPIIGYEFYHPENKSRLDLKYCNDTIKLNIPVSIDENLLYKYEPNSEFYTDNCNSYTTDNGTDIILNDRKQEFIDNNLSLCENNCNYIYYNKNDKQSSCECYIKNKMDLITEIIDNPNKLSNNFSTDESNSENINLITLKCTKELFSKDGLKNNISSYIIGFIFFLFLLSIILFIKCGYPLLEQKISTIINIISKSKKKHNKNKIKKRKKFKGNKNVKNPPKKISLRIINNINIDKGKSSLINLDGPQKKNNTNKKIKKLIRNKNIVTLGNNENIHINIKDFNIYEINNFSYKDAISYDKRNFCDTYISLLKVKHPIIFSFFPIDDYNSMIIKICITSISFSIYYAINFAFFDAQTIHKLYADKGKYNFIYFIPKISISFVCSYFINILIKYIFLSERNLSHIRKQPTVLLADKIAEKEKKNIIIKYIIFFILGIIFLAFFWMLLSSFGAVYQNTQFIIFENALISYSFSLVYPLFFNIFPSMLRIHSLISKKNKKECIYKLSQVLQLL